MLLKEFLFLGFSAIILHNASHPARSKVGSPSALHCAKLNRLIPVIADVVHKLALGTQFGMQAKISAGVSLMHASCHSSCCSLIWLSSDSGSLSQRMQWVMPFKSNSKTLLAPQAQGKNFDLQHCVPSLVQSLSDRHPIGGLDSGRIQFTSEIPGAIRVLPPPSCWHIDAALVLFSSSAAYVKQSDASGVL